MNFFNYETRSFWLFGIRILFGLWLLWAGLFKWVAIGPINFVGLITADFDKTWSPHFLNVLLSWVILIAEPVLSVLILTGKKPRLVWTLTAIFLFMLTFGQTILMKPDTIANWQYTILALVCASLSGPALLKSETAQ